MNLIAIISAFAVGAAAQVRPLPPAEMGHFEPLIGEWTGELTMGNVPGQQLKCPTVFRFEKILDGIYVQLTLKQNVPGMGVVKGQSTMAWNKEQKKVLAYTFANGGMSDPSKPRVEVGELTKGSIELSSVGGGPAYKQTFTVLPDGTLRYRFLGDMSGKGEMTEIGLGALKRKG